MTTRPQSPLDGVHIYDDFIQNAIITTTYVGELGWEFGALTTDDTASYLTGRAANSGEGRAQGVLRLTGAGAANNTGSYFRLFTDALVINEGPGGFACRVRYPEVTGNSLVGNNFRIGMDDSVTATIPGSGISVASDAGVLTCVAWSNDHGDTTITPAYTTTMVMDTWYTLRAEWSGENGMGGPRELFFYIDDVLQGSSTIVLDDDEEVEAKFVHWQDTGAAASLEWDLDFFEFWSWIDRSATAPAV